MGPLLGTGAPFIQEDGAGGATAAARPPTLVPRKHLPRGPVGGLRAEYPPTSNPGLLSPAPARWTSRHLRPGAPPRTKPGLASAPHSLESEGCTAQTASVCPLVRHSLRRPRTGDKPSHCQPSPRPTSPTQGWGFPGGPQERALTPSLSGPQGTTDTDADSWSRRHAAPTSSPPPAA